jgi:hypothetical protein
MRYAVSFPCGCVVQDPEGGQPQLVHCVLHDAAPRLRAALAALLDRPIEGSVRLQAREVLRAIEPPSRTPRPRWPAGVRRRDA